ncbi:MAG: redoxin domain-containing protein [Planctomycetes bacterium]|nr:redoxin domain-containing protein [Planctomycetota bacterium]
MTRLSVGLLILLLATSVYAGGEKQSDDKKPPGPSDEYQALLKEHRAELQAFNKAYREAKTNQEKQKVSAEMYPKGDKYALRFIELAEKNAKEPFAVDALIWIVSGPGRGSSAKADLRAWELLFRDHIASEKLGGVCQMLTFSFNPTSETRLRTLFEKSPHRNVKGKALLALGQLLKNRPDTLQQFKDRPELAKSLDDETKKLLEQDPKVLAKEAESILEQAEKEYGDVKLQFYGTIAAKAKSELFDIRHLSVGKTAPEVEGYDQDGKKFKLSDYRGKVVLLDFWSQF